MIRWLLALILMAGPLAAQTRPGDYTVQLPVTPAPGGGVQRLAVPARALAAVRTPDLADLRIFDAAGDAVPIALADLGRRREARTVVLPALPILGRPGALRVTGLSLRIDERGGERIVGIDGAVAPGADATVLGVLFDTRAITAPATAITLAADLPAQQPITFIVEASTDLKDWQQVGTRVIYRGTTASAGASSDAEAAIALADIDLEDRYLRLRWRSDAPLVAPVTVRSAMIATARPADTGPAAQVRITGAATDDPRVLAFAVAFKAPLASIAIAVPGDNSVIPVRVLGRDNREQPWTPIGAGTLSTLAGGTSPPIVLTRGFAEMRVEADPRTAGFPAATTITLAFAPVEILFVASGRAPFTLAAGRAATLPAYLPAATLVPDGRVASEAALPRATVASGDVTLAATPPGDGRPRRDWILWGVLVAGTLALLGMVAVLLRK